MFARPGFRKRKMVRRSVQALALMVAAGSEHDAQADFPVVVQSYAIVPESVVVTSGTVLMPTGFTVVAPRTVVRYETFPGPIVPTVTWLPGVTYLQTAEWLPMEMPCGSTVIEAPVAGTSIVESPVLSSPQTRSVEELPIESKAQETTPEPAKKEADEVEPELKHNDRTPPGLPELPKEQDLKPAAEAPKATAPKADASKEEEIPPNTSNPGESLPPAKETPRNAAPAETPPPAAKPADSTEKKAEPPAAAAPARKIDPQTPQIPLPEAATETKLPPAKPNAPVEPPPAAPAEEAKPGALVEPGSPQIPLPDNSVPELAPVNPGDKKPSVTPTSATGKSEQDKASKASAPSEKASTTKPLIDLPEIPPPVDELPPAKEKETARPVTPLPELPLPGELPPPQDTSAKPLDPQAVKADAKTQETTMKRREAQRPVIESKPGGTAEPAIAELEILVQSSGSGSPEHGVTVRFRETASGERFEAVTDRVGHARVVVPKGAWEVEVESHGGRRYILGDVVSKNGRVTTASGRDLPRLEIQR